MVTDSSNAVLLPSSSPARCRNIHILYDAVVSITDARILYIYSGTFKYTQERRVCETISTIEAAGQRTTGYSYLSRNNGVAMVKACTC